MLISCYGGKNHKIIIEIFSAMIKEYHASRNDQCYPSRFV